jgi:hypothetical protein
VADNSAQNNGGGLYSCNGTIKNNTVYGNSAEAGGGLADCSEAVITNSIIWNNSAADSAQIHDASELFEPHWCCIQNWPETGGNISREPLFADAANGDFHLKSAGKRWKQGVGWVTDAVTSVCIDTACFETTPNTEYHKNVENYRANMGAYGSTAEASIAPDGWALTADFTNDGLVNQEDYMHIAGLWKRVSPTYDFYYADLTRDYYVQQRDLAVFAEQWLSVTPWSWVQADLDGNAKIDLADYARMAANWQKSGAALAGDFDGSGQVGVSDAAFFAVAWLK